jgi:hypothetical protein
MPPDHDTREVDGCGFSRREIRAGDPALAAFLAGVAFEDGPLVFPTVAGDPRAGCVTPPG